MVLTNIIPPAQAPVIDVNTGIVNRDWYRFLSELAEKVDGLQFIDPGDPVFVVLNDAQVWSQALVDGLRQSGL